MTTQETVKKPGGPVIPLVPKPMVSNTIPPIPDGKPITKENRGSLPIQFWLTVEDKSSMPSTKTQLPIDLDDGVALTFLGGKAQLKTIASPNQKVSPFSFWGLPFLFFFGMAIMGVTVAVMLGLELKSNQSQNLVPTPQVRTMFTPETKISGVMIKANNPIEEKIKVDGLLIKEEKDEEFRVTIYKNQSAELIKLIADKDNAIQVYQEAVEIRRKAAAENNTGLMEQAIIRLQSLLSKSNLPYGYQRHAAKQLWVIFHCHWKNARLAKEALALLEKYNKTASAAEKVIVACPKDGV